MLPKTHAEISTSRSPPVATRTLIIKTSATGVQNTLRSIKSIDDALKAAAASGSSLSGVGTISPELKKALDALVGSVGQLDAGIRGVGERLGGLGRERLDGVNAGLHNAANMTQVFTQGLGLAKEVLSTLAVPFNIAKDLETNIAAIRTVSDVSESTLAAIKKLGTEVPQSMGDVAKAAYDALSAQVSENDLLPLLKASSDLAVLGMSDLTTATNATIVALATFGQDGVDSAMAADILFETVRRGRTTLSELAGDFPKVASTASAFGVSMAEVGAVMATLTKRGNDTAESAVQLNAVMKSIADPADEAAKLMKALGIEYGVAALQAKGVIGVLDDIRVKTGGSSQALTTLFGNVRALKGATGLLGDGLKTVSEDFERISNAGGTVDRQLDKVKVTTQAALNAFNALKEGALNDIGEHLLPVVRDGLVGLSEWYKENGPYLIEGIDSVAATIKEMGPALDVATLGATALLRALLSVGDAEDKIRIASQKRIDAAAAAGAKSRSAIQQEVDALQAKTSKEFEAAKGFADRAKYVEAWGNAQLSADAKIAELGERKTALEAETLELTKRLRAEKSGLSQEEFSGLEKTRRENVLTLKSYEELANRLQEFKRESTTRLSGSEAEIAAEKDRRGAVARTDALIAEQKKRDSEREKANKKASSEAQRHAEEMQRVLLRAQEEELALIADKDTRELALLRLKHGRALEERIKLMGAEHEAVKTLLGAQQQQLAEVEARQAAKKAAEEEKRAREKARADKEAARVKKAADKEAAASTKLMEEALGGVQDLMVQNAQSAIQAGVSALFYGSSVKDAVNDVLEALTIEATARAVFETGAGLAALGITWGVPNPSSVSHFSAAAAYTGLAVASGVGTLATGGFNGAAGGGGSRPDEVGSPEPRANPQAQSASTGPTVVNVNFSGTMPLATQREIGAAVQHALRAAQSSYTMQPNALGRIQTSRR